MTRGKSGVVTPWADHVELIDAAYVAWVGDLTQQLADALTTWFGPPAAA